ncbi:MAG: alkaline phosphatase family protein, partial [Phycisphaerales bacterium]
MGSAGRPCPRTYPLGVRVAVLNVVGLSPSVFARRKSPALQAFAQRSGGIRTLEPDFPAVTCTVQSSMLTGRR